MVTWLQNRTHRRPTDLGHPERERKRLSDYEIELTLGLKMWTILKTNGINHPSSNRTQLKPADVDHPEREKKYLIDCIIQLIWDLKTMIILKKKGNGYLIVWSVSPATRRCGSSWKGKKMVSWLCNRTHRRPWDLDHPEREMKWFLGYWIDVAEKR